MQQVRFGSNSCTQSRRRSIPTEAQSRHASGPAVVNAPATVALIRSIPAGLARSWIVIIGLARLRVHDLLPVRMACRTCVSRCPARITGDAHPTTPSKCCVCALNTKQMLNNNMRQGGTKHAARGGDASETHTLLIICGRASMQAWYIHAAGLLPFFSMRRCAINLRARAASCSSSDCAAFVRFAVAALGSTDRLAAANVPRLCNKDQAYS